MIHEMGVKRLRQYNSRSEISFLFQKIGDARRLLYIVLFHAVNALCTLLDIILEMDQCKGCDDAATAFQRM